MRNFSGMLSFNIRGDGAAAARTFAEQLKVFTYAVSLGKAKSLIYYLGTDEINRSSFGLNAENLASYRAFAGGGVFRVSVGLEGSDDLCADLAAALDQRA